ncbi:MAG: RICIN domain-containing protein [Oscillospiraceae bacterium]|nr:RICIN domain-containing protein [Oscillospiraceae bacterium]
MIYYIRNAATGRYLDLDNDIATNGRRVLNWSFNGDRNQQWLSRRNDDGSYRFETLTNSQFNLHNNGGNIGVWTSADNFPRSRSFFLVRNNNHDSAWSGMYQIRSVATGQLLIANGNNVQTTTSNASTAASWWSFERRTVGAARLVTAYTEDVAAADFEWPAVFMGYSPRTVTLRPLTTTVETQMQSSNVFIHMSHGSHGHITFARDNESITGRSMTTRHIQEMSRNSLSNVRTFISFGCRVGFTDPTLGNFINDMYIRGAHFSLGFMGPTFPDPIYRWFNAFWRHSANGHTIQDSILFANSQERNMPIVYSVGNWTQRLRRI